jgi:hypothetical protein
MPCLEQTVFHTFDAMLKRLAIFFFLLSFAGLQAHNIIPHHHENEITETDHHHDQNDEDDEEDFEYPLAELTHNAEFGKLAAKIYSLLKVEKPVFTTGFFDLGISYEQDENPPEYHPPGYIPLPLSYIFHDVPLRAPPACPLIS